MTRAYQEDHLTSLQYVFVCFCFLAAARSYFLVPEQRQDPWRARVDTAREEHEVIREVTAKASRRSINLERNSKV